LAPGLVDEQESDPHHQLLSHSWASRERYASLFTRLGLTAYASGVPLITQSDPGSENYGIANCQTVIRQTLDPSLRGTLQHKWVRKLKNIKPEIAWSMMRRQWSPGFETILENGVHDGLYDPETATALERSVSHILLPRIFIDCTCIVSSFVGWRFRGFKLKLIYGLRILTRARDDVTRTRSFLTESPMKFTRSLGLLTLRALRYVRTPFGYELAEMLAD
jgi:hypothetical protein